MIIKIHNHCQFEPTNSLSFQGFCKWCGKEQSEHSTTMSNNEQSSIDWLIDQLEKYYVKTDLKNTAAYQQAKAMHKEEHRKTFNQGLMSNFQNFDDYYNKTFNTKEK